MDDEFESVIKLLQFALLMTLSVSCLGSISPVQSNIGGNATATLATGGTITSSAVGFSNNTLAGSLLVIDAKIRQDALGGTVHNAFSSAYSCTTSGFSWTNNALSSVNQFNDNATAKKAGEQFFCFIVGASVMSSATTTTVSFVVPSNNNVTVSIEFSMYEFSGVGSFSGNFGGLTNNTGTPSQPSGPTILTSTQLMILPLVGYPGSNLTASAGWTLGPNDTVATIGQTVYATGLSGSVSNQFTGTLGLWATGGIVFNATVVGSVQRHRGSVF